MEVNDEGGESKQFLLFNLFMGIGIHHNIQI